ncbi:ATP-binding cassette domain-containing protein [Eggerthellaceae bacterium 24-137]
MLEARDLTASFDGHILFERLTLTVAPGERVQIAAPSGAGKTTLCRLLAGYAEPQGGQVLVDGAPLPRHGTCPVQLIGQHPERALDPRLRMEASLDEARGSRLGRAGRAPLRRGAEAPGDEARLLDGATMADDEARLLEELGIRRQWLTRYPRELSGGELQRFCIARALLARPRYLIADEVSTMLDAVTQARIWSVLLAEAERRNMGLVFVSHSPALAARIATRVVELRVPPAPSVDSSWTNACQTGR